MLWMPEYLIVGRAALALVSALSWKYIQRIEVVPFVGLNRLTADAV